LERGGNEASPLLSKEGVGVVAVFLAFMSTWNELKDNSRLRKIYETRIEIIKLIRDYFWSVGFKETDTPVAVKYPGQEPYLNPIPLTFHDPRGAEHLFHLQTSPEFAMKKLLAAGWEKIFQICKCFRDFEDFGGQHNTEFTMIEWYRAPGTLGEIMDDTENLFKYIAKKLDIGYWIFKDKKIQTSGSWDRLTMKEVWLKYVGINLDEYLEDKPMQELAKSLGFSVDAGDQYEDCFYKIFLNKIEPNLGVERPIFVYDYPARMSSLSIRCDVDDRYAERFELYFAGLELANAFGELLDADEQKLRLEEDRKLREKLSKETWPVDPDFIAALRSGIPAANLSSVGGLPRRSPKRAKAGGIALGIDRMVLLFTGARDLNEVIFQSVSDQIQN
jgi:elongation factor P--(R)-beta-lysine ligase